MNKITLFKQFTAKQLKAADVYFIEGGAAKVAKRFEDWIANHVAKGFDSGDTAHFDKVLEGARQFKRFRFVKRVFTSISVGEEFSQGLIPFEYIADAETFTGKADKDKLAALREMSEYKQADGTLVAVPVWEKLLRMALDNENAAEKASSKADFKMAEAFKLVLAKSRKAGNSEAQIDKAYNNARLLTRPAALPEGRKAA